MTKNNIISASALASQIEADVRQSAQVWAEHTDRPACERKIQELIGAHRRIAARAAHEFAMYCHCRTPELRAIAELDPQYGEFHRAMFYDD